jgi:hypothetical protein
MQDRDPPVAAPSYGREVLRRGSSPIDRLAGVGLTRPDPVSGEEWCLLPDGHLHSDADAICPRCLTWIEGREFVRRTAYGLLQHEVCPRG